MFRVPPLPKAVERTAKFWLFLAALAVGCAFLLMSERTAAVLDFVVRSFIAVTPLVAVGLLISAWVSASGFGNSIARAFEGRSFRGVLIAAAVGAVTPVCGVTVLPLMTGLLAAGVPLAPVMAFWLASPVTDPALFAATAATLGPAFALGKTLAAFLIGIFAGQVTAALASASWVRQPLRDSPFLRRLACDSACSAGPRSWAIWRDTERRVVFRRELWAMTRLVSLCLGFAFAAEALLQDLLPADALADYVGQDSPWAVPLAVFVGAPAYLDGFAALPLTRGLVAHGMSPGAAMAFLVSGSVVSIWGALAVLPVLRLKAFLLYLGLAVAGSLAAGWAYGSVS